MKKMWLPIITIIIVAIIIVLIIFKNKNNLYFNKFYTYKVYKVEDRKDFLVRVSFFLNMLKCIKLIKI